MNNVFAKLWTRTFKHFAQLFRKFWRNFQLFRTWFRFLPSYFGISSDLYLFLFLLLLFIILDETKKKRSHYFEAKFQYLLDCFFKKLNKKTIFVNVEERIAFVNYLPNTFFVKKFNNVIFGKLFLDDEYSIEVIFRAFLWQT